MPEIKYIGIRDHEFKFHLHFQTPLIDLWCCFSIFLCFAHSFMMTIWLAAWGEEPFIILASLCFLCFLFFASHFLVLFVWTFDLFRFLLCLATKSYHLSIAFMNFFLIFWKRAKCGVWSFQTDLMKNENLFWLQGLIIDMLFQDREQCPSLISDWEWAEISYNTFDWILT